MQDGDRNYLELQETTYMSEFKHKDNQLSSSMPKAIASGLIEIKDAAIKEPPKPRELWMGPSLIKLKLSNMPRFDRYLHDSKEIVKTLPKINVQCTTAGAADVYEMHQEVMRTRPRYSPVPCAPILDDVTQPEGRQAFVNFTYRVDHIPERNVSNTEVFGEEVHFPAVEYSTQKYSNVERRYPPIKPSLKPRLRYHESIQERNYDNFDIDFNRHYPRKFNIYEEEWGTDISRVMDHDLTRLKYRNYRTGYAGHITSKSLELESARKWTVDPMLSNTGARDSRHDRNDERTAIELRDSIMKAGRNARRTEFGVLHVPIEKYYHPCITNIPYKMSGDCVLNNNVYMR